MKEIRRIFTEIDADKDGAISKEEMRASIAKLGNLIPELNADNIDEIFDHLD